MIERERINHKIVLIENNLAKLQELSKLDENEFKSDFRNIESAKHLLQVSIECMIDICEHIVAKKRLGMPDTAAECIRMVFNGGYVSNNNMDTYITMTKFRNRIVHFYHDLNESEIYHILKNNLIDFKLFIKDIVNGFISE
ncbi:MAG: DUF86 domain-containing protein [Clostridiaceae bacterium]|jgi:uncharacterized protein YutE (UPF0331/DUF86 family)|nr:DUF86 domain-containing protein [Clostridiaceae bacterium]